MSHNLIQTTNRYCCTECSDREIAKVYVNEACGPRSGCHTMLCRGEKVYDCWFKHAKIPIDHELVSCL